MLQRFIVGVSLFLIAGLLVTLGFLGRVATETADMTPNLEDKTVLATPVSTQMSSIAATNPQDFLLLDEMRIVLQENFLTPIPPRT